MKYRYQAFLITQILLIAVLASCARNPKPSSIYEDGFLRRSPETQGVHSEDIIHFIEAAEDQGLELHSLMVLRKGRVIAEGWWHPYKSDINHIMHSVSKIYASTAVGFAVSEKLLTVDDKVISFFPEDLPAEISPGLREMTVKNLLTMSAGHDQAPIFYRTDENWVKSFLATPIDHTPGSKFVYSSYATYMLSAIITKLTGLSMFDYLKPRLFDPLDIKDIQWETDSRGINCGGWGMRIKTSDMAKLGQLYLQKGKWYGKQLLPESWIEEASSPHIYQRPDRSDEENANDDWAQGYGYQIWVCTHDSYRGDGANGQFIVVIPDIEMVVIMTANIGDMQAQLRLVWEHLIPSVKGNLISSDNMLNEALITKLSTLSIPDPFRTPDSLAFPREEKRSYSLEQNELNISRISFSLEEAGKSVVSYTQDGKSYDFTFGQDTWEYGATEKTGPYFLNARRTPLGLSPFRVAGYGSWLSESQLNLRLLYLTESQYETYICKFEGDKVTVEISNSMEAQKSPVILTGKKQ